MKASSGIDLMVSLDRDSAVGLRAQLEHQLREGVRSGTLHHDAPLPSTRALARELGVARGVVMEAYAQLAAEGYLVSRQGAPTRVAARAAAQPAAAAQREPGRRAMTSAPARPTSRSSRARHGPPPCARACATRPMRASATATRAAPPSCARRSPRTSAGCAASPRTPRRSW